MSFEITETILNNFKSEMENKRKISEETFSANYLDWALSFISTQNILGFSDDDFLYRVKEIGEGNFKMTQRLSIFFSELSKYAEKHLFAPINNDNSDFEEISYIFKYNDCFFEITTIFGQGASTSLTLLTESPDDYFKLDFELMNVSEKEELIQYIIVNKDLGMSAGKVAAQVGHVCTLCAIEEQKKNPLFHIWFNENQKKIVLGAHEKVLLELEKNPNFYAIRDSGLTEIAENSLTAISLGVTTKEKVEKIVKRLQLYK